MKLSIFQPKGIMPKMSPDLIGFQAAQIAENCDLTDGQIRPYDNYLFTKTCVNKGIVKTLYLYEKFWLEFEADVDIVLAPVAGDTQGKFYFTGSGIPKKANLAEAITGIGALPGNFFPLAVSAPKTAPTTAASSPPAGTGDDRYIQYIWTVVTSWGEESYPSPASEPLKTKHGQKVTLSAMSMIWVNGTSYDLNDTVFKVSAEGGAYMYLCVQAGTSGGTEPIWNDVVDKDTIDGTVRWKCYKNNLVSKNIYRLVSGDLTWGTYRLVSTINMNATSHEDTKLDTGLGGACYSLNSEDGGQADEDWDAPPQALTGIIDFGYGMVVGFIGKDVYISVPYKPWAFPIGYILSAPADIIAIKPITDGCAAVFTRSAVHLLKGSSPLNMQLGTELPDRKPCVSKRGAKTYSTGVIYPSTDGLRIVSIDGNNQLLTQNHHSVKTWKDVHSETLHACIHDNKYFGFYQADTEGGFVLDLQTFNLTTLDFYTFSTYVDPATDTLYFLRSDIMNGFNEIWTNPEAASATGKATQFNLAPGTLTGIVQPDYPRNLVYTIAGAVTSIQITVTGTLSTGEVDTEVITETTSSVGNKAFAHIDSIVVDSVSGGNNLNIGHGVKFGLSNKISASDDIIKVNIDNTDAGGTVSTTYDTIQFGTAPNGTHDYQVWYVTE